MSEQQNKDKVENTDSSQIIEQKSENTEQKENNTEPTEQKTVMGYYFSGLKYGLVFGLAIAVGFSIVQNNKELKQENTAVKSSINASDTIDIATQSIEIKKEILEK